MKSFVKIATLILLVLCFSFAVGCKDKDYVADYSNNEMPTLSSRTEETESGEEQIGEDNVVDFEDLFNPDDNNEEQSKNQSGSSSKTSTGSSSSSGASSTTSSKPSSSSSTPSSSSSKPSSSSSSQTTGSSKPSSSGATSSIENEMATGSETNAGKFDTPGNTWFQ